MPDLRPDADVVALKSKPWDRQDFAVPAHLFSVPGMLTLPEKRLLYYLASEYYAGQGAILDMGAFLGGSTICFAAAVAEREFDEPLIHSYDLFKLSNFEREKFFRDTPPPKDLRTRHIFEENLRSYSHLLSVHDGDVLNFQWEAGPIELLFIDIAKSYKVFDHLISSYFPALVPHRSLVILQDYLFHLSGPWHHVVMERLSEYFEYVVDTDINSVVFVLRKEIPEEVLRGSLWEAIPRDEKRELMKQAIARLDQESKRDIVRGCQKLLEEEKDMFWGMAYHQLS